MATLIRRIYEAYCYVNDELSDRRTQDFFLIGSPWACLGIIGFYLYFVQDLGPTLMEKRKPFELKRIMQIYNLVQIMCCSYVLYKALIMIWIIKYNIVCEPVDYSYTPNAIEVSRTVWLYFIIKIFDLLDTVFFVLRKKQNQVSFLHVYHHSGMVFGTWATTKFMAGGHHIFLGTLNCFVHVIMYSYYLATSMGIGKPWWKKHITQLQLAQFFLLLIHYVTLVVVDDCGFPKWTSAVLIPQNLFMMVLFGDFYYKTYIKKPISKVSQNGFASEGTNGNLKSQFEWWGQRTKIEALLLLVATFVAGSSVFGSRSLFHHHPPRIARNWTGKRLRCGSVPRTKRFLLVELSVRSESVRVKSVDMASLIRLVVSNYREMLEINKVIMVDTWPMMASPGPMLCIVGSYLAFVLKIGPKMMEKRPPFQLNALLIAYNAFQVAFSIWLTLRAGEPGLARVMLSSQCSNPNRTPTDIHLHTAISSTAWWYFIAKITELLDTVFFVLRKKQNQVTFLHVYHHALTAVFSWCYLKFLPGEQGAMIGFLNSFVHIVMYSYYLIAALGPNYRKYLWWKKYMTWIQLIQFVMMLGYLTMTLAMDCKVPKALTYFFMANVVIFIYLFSDFYRKAYKKKSV
ncbi:uncharacterized protein LOC122395889 [Colletes gigas]|uniref:uncharacterized protein LOC122395889 n=1 Tax=Colletes gigas TaxID=935657 RepID=UPI001C9B12FD|nr:uncharacterized protein LOC122395889 [Colletes gigas]